VPAPGAGTDGAHGRRAGRVSARAATRPCPIGGRTFRR
jgi:hypothetical protein